MFFFSRWCSQFLLLLLILSLSLSLSKMYCIVFLIFVLLFFHIHVVHYSDYCLRVLPALSVAPLRIIRIKIGLACIPSILQLTDKSITASVGIAITTHPM